MIALMRSLIEYMLGMKRKKRLPLSGSARLYREWEVRKENMYLITSLQLSLSCKVLCCPLWRRACVTREGQSPRRPEAHSQTDAVPAARYQHGALAR